MMQVCTTTPPAVNAYLQRECIAAMCKIAAMSERDEIRAWMQQVIAATGWSAAEWSRRAGTTASNITRMLTRKDASIPRVDTLRKLVAAAPADIPPPDFGAKQDAPPAPAMPIEMDDGQPFRPVPMPSPATLRKGLPVYGVAACHNGDFEGGFELNAGEVVDRVAYPPALVNVKSAYAIYAVGSSMEPRYEEGELVYVHPGKPPSPGCYVVVQLKPDHDGGPVEAFIKRLVRRTSEKVVLEQFNPARTVEIPLGRIYAMHRILNGNELF